MRAFEYPRGAKVLGMVVDATTGRAAIESALDALPRLDADLLVFLSVHPHDAQTRADWSEISGLVRTRGIGKKGHEIAYIERAEIDGIAQKISVMRLPGQ